jgi:hypothetical protein
MLAKPLFGATVPVGRHFPNRVVATASSVESGVSPRATSGSPRASQSEPAADRYGGPNPRRGAEGHDRRPKQQSRGRRRVITRPRERISRRTKTRDGRPHGLAALEAVSEVRGAPVLMLRRPRG